jgi:exodeoxyribonuclease III
MKIISWNIAGLRGAIKKNSLNFLIEEDYDIICFQETKTLEREVKIPINIKEKYPYTYWGENKGITQRKGLSGTAIWSKKRAIKQFETPEFDTEGRCTIIEYKKFIIITVYTPNSQDSDSERCTFRTKIWDEKFKEYIIHLNNIKPTIICGDFNVAHKDIDVYNADKFRNECAGFLDIERKNFNNIINSGFIDVFREMNPNSQEFSYWDQIRPHMRKNNKGWRIDYFLMMKNLKQSIEDCKILKDKLGSDHAPVLLSLKPTIKKNIKLIIKKKLKFI